MLAAARNNEPLRRCLTPEEVERFVRGQIPVPRCLAIDEHLNWCYACAELAREKRTDRCLSTQEARGFARVAFTLVVMREILAHCEACPRCDALRAAAVAEASL